ncbi:hypothetical protein L336_0629 [Candidatus Saccharimonas aalborgensis]|uniref:Uncharacterized protein n=1 Tax=Candidatus Saccharimonas aalborgensis TaxID=1332188 RepID=R4PX47_9BACT|nr:hypothetical protein [Candidatus Saccharimonas aalborgensis]AGL62332.1 hypothetical protein L336_0629 [Candidatus Saccharimonas aalborgensis]QQS68832.1 MAG: hypothetical protein IPP24_02280 [Candidatus Saccharibacteria bacterium]QQS71117.1 MAG: hypothetical protein IPP92_02410 [Candidatus Saccharibacteria bacterium]
MAERLKSASPEAPNGGGFDPTFTAELRVGLDRVVDDSSATLAAAGEALIQSGRLGHVPPDLALPSPRIEVATARQSVASAFENSPDTMPVTQDPSSQVERSNSFASLQEQAIPAGQAGRRIYAEGPDGTPLTGVQWDALNQEALSNRAGPSAAELHEAHIAERAQAYAADQALLKSLPPEFVSSGLEKYGREGFLAVLKGKQEPSAVAMSRTADGEATFTHATTGEVLSVGEVQDRIDHAEARRIGHSAASVAEAATTQLPFAEELIDTDNGLVYVEKGHLGDGLDMVIEIRPDGTLGDVDVVVTEEAPNGSSETHEVDVVTPESDNPDVLIDGEPATPKEAATVEAVIDHVGEVVHEQQSRGNISNPQEVQRETLPQEMQEVAQEVAPEESPAVEQQTAPEEAAPVANGDGEAVQPSRAQERAPFSLEVANNNAVSFVSNYARNPKVRELLAASGVDLEDFLARGASGELRMTSDKLAHMKSFFAQNSPRSQIWNERPGNASELQRAAARARQQLLSIIDGI